MGERSSEVAVTVSSSHLESAMLRASLSTKSFLQVNRLSVAPAKRGSLAYKPNVPNQYWSIQVQWTSSLLLIAHKSCIASLLW